MADLVSGMRLLETHDRILPLNAQGGHTSITCFYIRKNTGNS